MALPSSEQTAQQTALWKLLCGRKNDRATDCGQHKWPLAADVLQAWRLSKRVSLKGYQELQQPESHALRQAAAPAPCGNP